MLFEPARLSGAWIISPERHTDHRGFFARTFCEREFVARGLHARFVQSNISFNARRGTLRGLHYQVDPHPEVKLVRCTSGAVYDVIVDLRRDSPTYGQSASFELSAENRTALYIPGGLAHGFQTLAEATELLYDMGEFYYPELARGVRWNDPAIGIDWPIRDPILSDRDRNYPDLVL